MKTSALSLAAAAATVLAAPVMASASAQVLFSQSAATATTSAVRGASGTVSMRTAHKAVLAFEERPGTRTGLMSEAAFSGLWGGAFHTDPPNAILTGVDPLGRNHRVVVRVTSAARTAHGVRYQMRALRGSLPARLSPANLMVDSVPITAISAALKAYLAGSSAKANTYETLINALHFPMMAPVTTSPQIVILSGSPMVGSSPNFRAQVINGQQIVFEPGAQMVFPPSTTAVSIVSPQGPGPCAWPDGLQGSAQVLASTGGTTDYPGTSLPGVVITSTPLFSGICQLVYDITTIPAKKAATTFQVGITFTNTSSQPVVLQPVQISAD